MLLLPLSPGMLCTFHAGFVGTKALPPVWFLIVAGLLLGLGFWFYGYHIIRAIGNKITQISQNRGFSIELEAAIYLILKQRFRSHPAYIDIVELFHETSWQTELGQLCDLITAPEDNVNLDNFSMEKYMFIVTYKTAYYSFYLPLFWPRRELAVINICVILRNSQCRETKPENVRNQVYPRKERPLIAGQILLCA